MIYAVCGGIPFYLLEYSGQFFLARMHRVPWGCIAFDLWYYISDLCFAAGCFPRSSHIASEQLCFAGHL